MVTRYYEVEVKCDFGLVEVEVEFASDDPMPTENEIHDAACEVIESALSNSKLESYRQSQKRAEMSKYTPGPWFSLGAGDTDYTVIASNKGEEVVGVSEWIRAEDEDLRLMAAAPEMLEMLDEIALQIRRGQDISEWYSKIADTIAKAKGEQ